MIRLTSGGYTLLCEETKEGLVVTGYEGSDSRLVIPEGVVALERKALLGCQGLKKVIASDNLRRLGSWCLAQCRNLETVILKASPDRITMDRNALDGCSRIRSLVIGYEEPDDTSLLLGAVVNRLPAPYLLADPEIGTKGWYERWDHSLITYLKTNDHEGFSERILCGEEDISYDGVGSVDGEMPGESAAYINEIRKKKCYLCLLRLMHCTELSCETAEVLRDYITHNEACWQVLKEEFGENIEIFRLYMELVKPNKCEIDKMLEDLGESHTQAKAFLISFSRGEGGQNDGDAGLDIFFNDLMI